MTKICEITVNIPRHTYLKHLQAIDPSFVNTTKPLRNKIKPFCKELK